jgi:glycosyltransferase involved in cell wall biosynthesis
MTSNNDNAEHTDPRHIAMFCHALDDRTLASICVTVCDQLTQLGVQTSLVFGTQYPGIEPPVPRGIELVNLDIPYDRTSFAIPKLARWLRTRRPDALFSSGNGPNRAAVLARSLSRVETAVITVEQNHYSSYIAPTGGGYSLHFLRDLFTGLLYPRADRIAGVAPELTADLEERFPSTRDRTVVLPNPGPDPVLIERLSREPCHHPWYQGNGSERPQLICSVANVIPRKGQDVLVEALPLVREACGDVRLILVGRLDNNDFKAQLEHAAARLGVLDYISFLGYRDNPLPLIAGSDVFALGSRNEGAPLVLIEAMTCGIPVVSTDCPSGPSYILEGGRSGRLVPMDNPTAMAQGLVDSLGDPDHRGRMIEEGRRRAREFTPRRVAEAYLSVARECQAERAEVT